MLVLAVFAFLMSIILCLALMVFGKARARLYGRNKPQRFHHGHVPRFGGLAVLSGCGLAWCLGAAANGLGMNINVDIEWEDAALWLLVLAPVVAVGVLEDYTQKLGPRLRLAAGAATAALGCAVLGLSVQRLGMPPLEGIWQGKQWLGIGLAFVALTGLPHAFNMIDGYNGLAGIVTVLISSALAYVALQLGDRMLAAMLVPLVGATLGFLYWNYPRGLIFAGDGGAYLWGAAIGMASIMLVQRNDEVSPWFPMLLLIYPVWETAFSAYRKLVRGVSPGVADALHFHQLIYRRIVRGVVHDDVSRRMLMRNNRTSPYLWSFSLLTVIPAVLFWRNTPVLMGFCGLFVFTYVAIYIAIIRFKIPRWLRH
jgi:UDP-GlcNAc:undecaprenyl-phosphate/decaprenyl-phosphate GlcNAc-1-phosphate transferase